MPSVVSSIGRTTENRWIIGITGDLDLAGVWDLDFAFRRALAKGASQVVLDLSQLAFVDCTGVGSILGLFADCKAAGASLQILPGPPAVQRVFELCEAGQVLPFEISEGGDGRPGDQRRNGHRADASSVSDFLAS